MTRATGTFDVKLSPQAVDEKADASLGRMSIDKQFHGNLEGSSTVEMLSASTSVKSSGAYVAIERVSGTLLGRSGSFTLQHSGTMTRGAPQLTITVVTDSGSDQLKGLAGKMMITITDGKHSTISSTPWPRAPENICEGELYAIDSMFVSFIESVRLTGLVR